MFFSMMNLFFMMNLILTLIIGCSSNSWAISWMMMEINVMMFIPLLSFDSMKYNNSNSIKYFLAQAMGSMILLVTLIMWMPKDMIESINLKDSLMVISMAIKSGIPPFHFWFPQLLEDSNFVQSIMLLTTQKVIPLTFLSYSVSDIFIFLCLISALVGAVGGLNQNSMFKVIAYSSMIHSAWLLLAMLSSLVTSYLYFLFYCLITSLALLMFKKMTIKKISQMSMFEIPLILKLVISLNLMSLGGLPPFMGFINKLMVISLILSSKTMIILTALVSSSLVSLYYYTRIVYSVMTYNSLMNKSKTNFKSMGMIQVIILSITINLLFPLVILIL